MSNPFFEKSKIIANDFLQSIVFLDDRAYSKPEDPNQNSIHDLDALEITKIFSKSKQICAVYDPETLEDLAHFEEISKKSDVLILDWFINISDICDTSVDLESDAVDNDIRGIHTKRIISNLISQNNAESLKLILVYTGETDLIDILNQIVSLSENSNLDEDNFVVYIGKLKILVRAKDNNSDGEDTRFKHLPKSQKMILSYSNLPSFILDEFTKMTCGLLSNFALLSLTSLRQNSSKLLALFSKEMDNAFLLHKLLLPNPNDANDQLIQNFSQTIEAMLNYINDSESILSSDLVESWLEELNINVTKKICKKDVEINTAFLKKWLKIGYSKTFDELWIENNYEINQLKDLDKSLSKVTKEEGVKFLKEDNNPEEDTNFSILTLHKSNIKNFSYLPKLALGSIVKHIVNEDKTEYFLCIQAKCDSIRLEKDRRFIFIELDVVQGNASFNLLTRNTNNDVLKFRNRNKSYDLKTFKFKPSNEKDTVFAKPEGSYHYFETIHNEKLIWLCDLKDMQAQRISNIIASQISRVGLDESEWLRRWSN